MTLDLNKPLQVLGGEKFTPLSVNGRGHYPIVGYIGSGEVLYKWDKDGYPSQGAWRLVNVPERIEYFASVYSTTIGSTYPDKSSCITNSSSNVKGMIKIIFEDGKFAGVEKVS